MHSALSKGTKTLVVCWRLPRVVWLVDKPGPDAVRVTSAIPRYKKLLDKNESAARVPVLEQAIGCPDKPKFRSMLDPCLVTAYRIPNNSVRVADTRVAVAGVVPVSRAKQTPGNKNLV